MIYVFLAEGFEETEAIAPVDILRRAGIDVKTVGIAGRTVVGSHGIPITADMVAEDLTTDDMEMIVLPGGLPGTLNLEKNDMVKSCVNYCYDNNKYVAAICAAPSILGHMGLLKGRKATCSPGFSSELEGAEYTNESVTVDGKIITGNGAGAAIDFGLKIVELLADEDKAQKIAASMQHKYCERQGDNER